jgi:LysM repeat protein
MALLMQGCKPSASQDTGLSDTNSLSEVGTNLIPLLDETNTLANMNPSNAPTPPELVSPVATNVIQDVVPPVTAVTEHKIAKGESFAKLALQYHVTANAIKEANPSLDPAKLQIGQIVKIPAPTAVGTASSTTVPSPTGNGGLQNYTVASGDTLIKIANQFGVTVKAIRTVNKLTTDKIKVGQRLKIPVKAGAAAPATTSEPAADTAPTGAK